MDGLLGLLPILLFLMYILLRNAGNSQRHAALLKHFSKLQRKRKSRILALVHRQEAMGLLGIPQLRYIDLNDSEVILDAIRNTPKDRPLEIVLHTPGGLVLPALQIARAIKAHRAKTTVFVPHYAMSGGTLISLAADEVVLSPHAVLGPIDPQIGGLPAASVVRVAKEKPIANTDDYTLVLADVGAMAINQLEQAARELLSGTVSENAAIAIAEQLSSGRWTHDFPITANFAQELGLNVSEDMPADIMGLMEMFPDTVRQSKSVRFHPFEAKSKPVSPAAPAPVQEPTPVSMSGFKPLAGRSYSFGPWNPKDVKNIEKYERGEK